MQATRAICRIFLRKTGSNLFMALSVTELSCRFASCQARYRHDRSLRSREPCRPLDHRARCLHRYEYSGHPLPVEGGEEILGRRRRASPITCFITSPPMRYMAPWVRTTRRSSETTPYAPNSPYAASKASSDHLVRSYHHTFGLKVTTSNCSNNYGPYQFPEKLLPVCILNILAGKDLPIYGDGQQIRDWLYVDDHNRGIELSH